MVYNPLELNYDRTVEQIINFIQKTVRDAKADGVVLGLSGGVDSSVVATLCVKALGHDKVLGVLMSTSFTPEHDIEDANIVANWLNIETLHINTNPAVETFIQTLHINPVNPGSKLATGNILSRSRMVILYYYANTRHRLVAGTGDKSETLIGYFTKHGDGGADLQPIAHLYKTQVRKLAEYLGIPKEIANKPSSPRLYPGHKATDEIPAEYAFLDPILYSLFDENATAEEAANKTGTDQKIAEELLRRHRNTAHKRTPTPTVKSLSS